MLGRTILAAIEVIAACVAVYYGVQWYLEPSGSHEPAFALSGFVFVVTELIRRYTRSAQIDPERLADFIREGQALRVRLDEDPLPIREQNDWVDRMVSYFKRHKGRAYEARLSDFSGMTFYGDGSERSKMSNSIDGRLRRLHEFLTELRSE